MDVETREALSARAIRLAWFTIAYNLVEGVASIAFGLSDESMALAGFGVDSFIEVASAVIVLWRFKAETGRGAGLSLPREREATLAIGGLFILLSLATATGAAGQLHGGSHPRSTLPGLVIAVLSLSFMFFLWRAKKTIGRALDSSVVIKDADCSLACIKLSVILFVGSLLFIVWPSLWWADAAAALLLSVLIAREGLETVRAARSRDFSGGCGCS